MTRRRIFAPLAWLDDAAASFNSRQLLIIDRSQVRAQQNERTDEEDRGPDRQWKKAQSARRFRLGQ